MIQHLQKQEFVRINELLIQQMDGKEVKTAYLRENALDFLLETVDSDMLGRPLYPEIYQKAGLYLFNIIADLVFSEKNLQTAFASTLFFLQRNGYQFKPSLNQEEIRQFVEEIATHNFSLKEVQLWLKQSIETVG